MGYFANFPLKTYNFGNNEPEVLFENISAYVDIIDQLKDEVSYYDFITISDGDRPDTLSYRLYGTTEYYWTFYLLNESIRKGGWPQRSQELFDSVKYAYPNSVVYTESPMVNSTDEDFNSWFNVGDLAIQGSAANPSAKGIVVERDLNLGQITVKPTRELEATTLTSGGSGYSERPEITVEGGGGTGAIITAQLTEQPLGNIQVVNGGYGYSETPTITIEGGGGSGATATALVRDGVLIEIELTNPGSGYVSAPIISIVPQVEVVKTSGSFRTRGWFSRWLRAIYINRGALLTKSDGRYHWTISFDRNLGGNAVAQASLAGGAISSLAIANPGTGYTSTPTVTIALPDKVSGTRATATVEISSATFNPNVPLKTIAGNNDNLSWDEASEGLQTITVKGVEEQWKAIHHYKNATTEYLDLPINSAGGVDVPGTGNLDFVGVTNLDRVVEENEKLKKIKILKKEVVQQVASEFQKFLRSQ